ncbi:MAG: DEAD/DEAH box helicase [Sulfurovum sp.]|nr:DEAD/DEAH box helicase [Sulfurovum sp.]
MECIDILNIIRFDASKEKQEYSADKIAKDMFDLQVEGTSEIINKLNHFQVALLADEVGMGKTFQALATITWQFKENSNSKVLVITPRREVLSQWKNEEYEEFYTKHIISENKYLPHYENSDNFIGELSNFKEGLFEDDNNRLVFAKTTSFMTSDNLGERAEKLLEDIQKFDLIVVDEAHKFRNYNEVDEHSSYMVQTAEMLFQNIDEKTKVLLMTATPLHSREGDLKRIVELFNTSLGDTDQEIMAKVMIRRLRVMSNGQNKYDYRNEIDLPISLTDEKKQDFKNELFFAMLQKQYATKVEDTLDLSKSRHLLNYLEGTRFDTGDEISHDKLIQKVIRKYSESYEGLKPSNRKYDELISKVKDDVKALVFVRRTASAYEIARLYIELFDKKAWALIDNAIDNSVHINIPKSRDDFERIIKNNNFDKDIKNVVESFEWNDFETIIEKFRTDKKNIPDDKKYIVTETAKNIVVSHYFEQYDSYKDKTFIEFLKNLNNDEDIKGDEDNFLTPKSLVLDLFKRKKGVSSTHASRFLQKFSNLNSQYATFFEQDFKNILGLERYDESKFDLIKSAVLHASIGLVELYCCEIRAKGIYSNFLKEVEKQKDNLEFIEEIKEFLEHFDKFEKYLKLNINTTETVDEELTSTKAVEYDFKVFHNAQPAYPYVGSTKNSHVISRFNSPFFPKLLCGTSTLQEGVNLHLFCDTVYHFGAANTMGDDEQRVGRVDRLMGKMDRRLKDNKINATLDIHYPYLKTTFDEENLRKMLCNKRKTEKLIDKGTKIVHKENVFCENSIEDLLLKNKNNSSMET